MFRELSLRSSHTQNAGLCRKRNADRSLNILRAPLVVALPGFLQMSTPIFFFYVAPAIDAGIVVNSSAALLFYSRFSARKTHFGMLSMLFLTFLVYGVLNLICDVLYALPGGFVNSRLPSYSMKAYLIVAFTPLATQLIVSLSATFLAFDRVLLMSIPVRYTLSRISFKLAVLVGLINAATVSFFYIGPFAVGESYFDLKYIFDAHNNLKYYLLPASLTVESALYLIFLFQLRRYAANPRNGIVKKQSAQTNHIVIFQMIVTTCLCTIPNWAKTVDNRLNDRQNSYFDQYLLVAFHSSVFLSSAFALFKFRPKWRFTRIASTSTISVKK